MKRDSKLSGVLHVLLHMLGSKAPATSEHLALMMGTNPVVVRRVMAGLREQGFVTSAKGHGGGWLIACDPAKVTLADIYAAVGEPTVIAMGHRSETPECLVEQAVNRALDDAFREAESVFAKHLKTVTLAALSEDFNRQLAARGLNLESQTHAI
ncbi:MULTISPECIES: Rrf2 family transcriptional regulator [unclassified Beijerinckia]|uniref:Rrf2 family transcriptional regulator n=1 Tax=unclassified Beijerinckia TaxID=2638183 RepID=UPI000895B3AB|nr:MULTISPECIES: Rrf2 family transcriptional regulator [unclassified Beijerinckia]MDH7797610.1 DNA-binding IscR family transcriptional regulator [Beijerinckia sp. GAS462]SEC92255.1 transcriptional regulator, BadM/Rrf2 family [Beijerinckia sp. 28-YEA-48]